jgi:hypothetical protein
MTETLIHRSTVTVKIKERQMTDNDPYIWPLQTPYPCASSRKEVLEGKVVHDSGLIAGRQSSLFSVLQSGDVWLLSELEILSGFFFSQ